MNFSRLLMNTAAPSSSRLLLSDMVTKSLIKEMIKSENNLSSFAWKRLHLSRAKLKASSRTSALLSGFAMIAMVEVQLSPQSQSSLPLPLLIGFSVITTLLVSIHMLALMISTCILPNVEAVASVHGLVAVRDSPHEKLDRYIEIAWTFSTVIGIFLFLIEIAVLCWVKFWDVGHNGRIAALAATIVLIPIFIVFIAFAIHFYRKLVGHKCERSAQNLQELESMAVGLQNQQVEVEFNNGSALLNV